MSLGDLLPWVMEGASPTSDGDEPIAHAGFHMAMRQIDFMPVLKNSKVMGRISGREVLVALSMIRKAGFKSLETRRVTEVLSREVGQVAPGDHLPTLLDAMIKTGFGHACIVEKGEFKATVSLRDLFEYASRLNMKMGLRIRELANPVVALSNKTTVMELIDTLFTKRIRRVVVRGESHGATADDRLLVQYAFSDEGLLATKDATEEFFRRPLSSLRLTEPGNIGGDADLAEAWATLYRNPAECLMVEGEDRILTPWDAVIKPYRLTKFPV